VTQPNILLLMSDQHTARLMGCAGAAFVRTPNMDRLVREDQNRRTWVTQCYPGEGNAL
jgi:hypothetical protein